MTCVLIGFAILTLGIALVLVTSIPLADTGELPKREGFDPDKFDPTNPDHYHPWA